MDGFKVVLAIILIVAVFIFLPQIFAIALGGGVFGGFSGSEGTLSEPEVGQSGVLAISFNGGDSFEESRLQNAASPNVLSIEKFGSLYLAGTDRGLLISKDSGLNWYPFSDLENQIDAGTVIYDFALALNKTVYVSAYKNDHGAIYVTHDNFFTVTPIWTEPQMPVRAILADQNFLYMGLDDGRLLRYSFSSGTFQKVNSFNYGVTSLTFADSGVGPKYLFAGLQSGRVYSDSGTRSNFTEIAKPSRSFLASREGLQIINDPQNSRTLYLASLSGIFRSEDQGGDWRELNSILPERAEISSLAVSGGKIFAAVGAKIYKSSDGGATWQIKEPIPTDRRLSALFAGSSGGVVVVGTSI